MKHMQRVSFKYYRHQLHFAGNGLRAFMVVHGEHGEVWAWAGNRVCVLFADRIEWYVYTDETFCVDVYKEIEVAA